MNIKLRGDLKFTPPPKNKQTPQALVEKKTKYYRSTFVERDKEKEYPGETTEQHVVARVTFLYYGQSHKSHKT